MSYTKMIMKKHLAELILLEDIEMEGFDVATFAAEMDETLKGLGLVYEPSAQLELFNEENA